MRWHGGAGGDHPCRTLWPGRGGPAPGERAGAARESMMRTTPRRRPARWAGRRRRGSRPRRSSWRSETAPGCSWPRRGPQALRGCGRRWPGWRSWPPCTAAKRWTQALGRVAAADRFADADRAPILAHQACEGSGEVSRAGEQHTLPQGISGWARQCQEAARRRLRP